MIEQRTGGPTWDKNTPASLLEHLAWDKNEVARHSVAANPNTLQSVSWRIPDDDTGAVKVVARGGICGDQAVRPPSKHILGKLADDDNPDVRRTALAVMAKPPWVSAGSGPPWPGAGAPGPVPAQRCSNRWCSLQSPRRGMRTRRWRSCPAGTRGDAHAADASGE